MKFFTADTHFGHHALAKSRGFVDAAEHDDYVLKQINFYVHRNDDLYILGDFAFDKPSKYRLQIVARHVHLIIGNHDRPLKSAQTFGDTPKLAMTKIKTQHTVLAHYPIAYWPASHHGSFHLYGHTHGMREETLDTAFPGRRSMDVGLDYAFRVLDDYRPFSEDEIYELLIARPGHDFPAFYDGLRADGKAPPRV